MSIAISIRLPDGLANELTHIADETERPRSFHIQRALESYIADFADVQIALERMAVGWLQRFLDYQVRWSTAAGPDIRLRCVEVHVGWDILPCFHK